MRLVIQYFALLFLFCGCSLKKVDLNLPDRAVSIDRKSEVIDKLNSQIVNLKSYRVFGVAKNEIDDHTYRVRYIFATRHPEDLHFQSLPINSATALTVLKSNGKDAVLLDTGPEIAYLAKGDESLLERALGAPILSRDVQYLLSGRIPERVLRSSPVVFEGNGSIVITDENQHEVYEIDPNTWVLKKATVLKSSKRSISWKAYWSDYETGPTGEVIPKAMILEIPSKSYRGTFSWRSVDYNPTLKQNLFDPKVPEGWKREKYR